MYRIGNCIFIEVLDWAARNHYPYLVRSRLQARGSQPPTWSSVEASQEKSVKFLIFNTAQLYPPSLVDSCVSTICAKPGKYPELRVLSDDILQKMIYEWRRLGRLSLPIIWLLTDSNILCLSLSGWETLSLSLSLSLSFSLLSNYNMNLVWGGITSHTTHRFSRR